MADFFAKASVLTGSSMASAGYLGTVDSTQKFPLGTVVPGTDAVGGFAEYIYLRGIGSTVVGSVVTYDEAGVTALITSGAVGPVAVATAITVADTFGWYGMTGTFPTKVAANCADNARLGYESASGVVGDGFSGGDQIVGAVSRASTSTAAVVNCQFNRPFIGTNVA